MPDNDEIEMMFRLMEYDELSEAQLGLIQSFEIGYHRNGWLSTRQYEILEDIFKKAAEKVEWSR